MAVTVFRHPHFIAEPEVLRKIATELVEKTRFGYFSEDSDAPDFTNCVTSIRYLLRKGTNALLPSDWLGECPALCWPEVGRSSRFLVHR